MEFWGITRTYVSYLGNGSCKKQTRLVFKCGQDNKTSVERVEFNTRGPNDIVSFFGLGLMMDHVTLLIH